MTTQREACGSWSVAARRTVELEAHAVVDLVVVERDVILVHGVPLLDPQLFRPRARLRCEQLLQVADRVFWIALYLRAEKILSAHVIKMAGVRFHRWHEFYASCTRAHPYFLAQPVVANDLDHGALAL